MSVSTRSTKAQMYSEIERLRTLCDLQSQQLRGIKATEPRTNTNEALRTKLAAVKAFATKFRCSARLQGDNIELYSKKRGCWVSIPEGAQP